MVQKSYREMKGMTVRRAGQGGRCAGPCDEPHVRFPGLRWRNLAAERPLISIALAAGVSGAGAKTGRRAHHHHGVQGDSPRPDAEWVMMSRQAA